jgi:hypothetical protein
MSLTKRSASRAVYLEVKHYSLWQALKKPVEGCEEIEVTNPKTKAVLTKYGFMFNTVTGHATKLLKYDTEKKYATRYFGFKLHLVEGADTYVLDMPYNSQMLRRFLKIAPNVLWSAPLSITIFKGKKKDGGEDLGVWFQQHGETVRPYFTREHPNGMPEAAYDKDLQQWDFRTQHRWLVAILQEHTIPEIEHEAQTAPQTNGETAETREPETVDETTPYEISDEDVPF